MADLLVWRIRPERPADAAAVEALADLTFGPGRFAKTSYRFREGAVPEARLGFVAEADPDGDILGSVRFWPIAIGGTAALLLGPLGVMPHLRGRGIGIALMQRGIDAARVLPYAAILLVGDQPYYGRVGFARIPAGKVRLPGPVDPQRLLGLALVPGVLETLSGEAMRANADVPVSAQPVVVAPPLQRWA